MSYRRNNTSAAATTTHATRRPAHAGQRSYIVNIDTGSFADVEIIVGDYHHRAGAGVWAPTPTPSSRAADTVKVVTSKSHVYAYVPTSPSTPTTKQRTPFTQLASAAHSHSSSSTSVSDTWGKRSSYERGDRARDYEYIAARQHRLADERLRAHHQREREREAEARRFAEEAEAEAHRAAAAAKQARRRQRLAEQQRHEEQKRQQEQQRALREDRRRLERTRRARAHEIANAWSSYETRWGLLSQNQSQNQRQLGGASLTFERIPWPVADSEVIIPPLDGRRSRRRRAALDELLRPEAIREFILSPAHSPEVSSKDRIRTALRRWHPDKFARLLGLVVESDRDAVVDGVGIVVRCLNEMLERENHA
ncbi:hypothetical protein V8E52_009462 [Russula decolorans]